MLMLHSRTEGGQCKGSMFWRLKENNKDWGFPRSPQRRDTARKEIWEHGKVTSDTDMNDSRWVEGSIRRADGALVVCWPTRRNNWGLGANKHGHNAIVSTGPCFNGGSPNLTPATPPVFSSTAQWHSASTVTAIKSSQATNPHLSSIELELCVWSFGYYSAIIRVRKWWQPLFQIVYNRTPSDLQFSSSQPASRGSYIVLIVSRDDWERRCFTAIQQVITCSHTELNQHPDSFTLCLLSFLLCFLLQCHKNPLQWAHLRGPSV